MRPPNPMMRERILVSTIREIDRHGLTDFSIRRVATECGISCAAPYKHFKNKQTLILEVLRYVGLQWKTISTEIAERWGENYRQTLIELCLSYIRFLCDNPGYYSIVLLNDSSLDEEQIREKGKISVLTEGTVERYCLSVQMPEEVRRRKLYVVRSLIYGAAIMITSGALENREETYETIRSCIDREFDLP